MKIFEYHNLEINWLTIMIRWGSQRPWLGWPLTVFAYGDHFWYCLYILILKSGTFFLWLTCIIRVDCTVYRKILSVFGGTTRRFLSLCSSWRCGIRTPMKEDHSELYMYKCPECDHACLLSFRVLTLNCERLRKETERYHSVVNIRHCVFLQ